MLTQPISERNQGEKSAFHEVVLTLLRIKGRTLGTFITPQGTDMYYREQTSSDHLHSD